MRILAFTGAASFIAVCILSAPAARAYESFPEFTTLSELEQAHLDRPSLLGPEYQSDMYAFARPYNWQYAWLSNKIVFDTTFGSISPVHFLMDTRAKIQAPLTSWLELRFLHFDERHHEREAKHTIFELIAWPWKSVGLGMYGEPSYNKRENDVGLAFFVKPSGTHEIKLFRTWVDIVRQRRSDRNDTFARDALPYATGIVGRWWSDDQEKNFLEYAVRSESPSTWAFPDELYLYKFRREVASLSVNKKMSPSWRLNVKLQGDKKYEGRSRTSAASTATEEELTTRRILATLQAPLSLPFHEGWELIPTFQIAHRHWQSPRDNLICRDYLFGLFAGVPGWFFDYSATWHVKTGGTLLAHPDEKPRETNHRVDVGYAFAFSPKAELRIRAGFDADSFGTKSSWEAGAAQFRWSL